MTRFRSTYDAGPNVDGGECLSLHRNENLFVGSDWTVDVAREVVAGANIAAYPDPACVPLRRALAELYGVSPDQVFVGNGSDEVLADLLALLRARYDRLHVLDVGFKVYPLLAERLGFRLGVLPGDTFHTGRLAADGFRGLAVIDSPNAISGASLQREALLGLAAEDGSFLIWDNVYGEYAGDTRPEPLAENVVFVRSFSKYYALAGLRVGYCIADARIVSALLERKDPFNVNGFAQAMALEALRRRDHFAALRDKLTACRQTLVERLEELGFHVWPPSGIAVLATHPRHSAESLQAELLKRNVVVRRFADAATANSIRITVSPMAGVDRCTAALRQIVGHEPGADGI